MEAEMNPQPSVFDLSPSEKLRLVEDLWDGLAGTPDVVPVHDWQQQELARRKANLEKNPTFGMLPQSYNPPPTTNFWVIVAQGSHPFPSRTRQLSPAAPM